MYRVRGQFDVRMDAKGRLPLPSRLRDPLREAGQSSLILTAHDGGLHGYTLPRWRKIERRFAGISMFDRGARAFLHSFVAGAAEVRVDGHGRINIPPALRRKAGLERSCVVLSYLWLIEIWDAERWEAREAEAAHIVQAEGGLRDFIPLPEDEEDDEDF